MGCPCCIYERYMVFDPIAVSKVNIGLTKSTHFDLVDLRLFVKVAEEGSLTKGAQKSHLSLAAASLRIKNLEEALGTQLLHRAQRGVTLTPSGESLLTRSYAVLQEIAQLQDEMKPYSEGVRGNVRLYANATAISELLPNVLAKFFTTHPHVTVDLQERLSMEIVQVFATAWQISVSFRHWSERMVWKRFHIKKIGVGRIHMSPFGSFI